MRRRAPRRRSRPAPAKPRRSVARQREGSSRPSRRGRQARSRGPPDRPCRRPKARRDCRRRETGRRDRAVRGWRGLWSDDPASCVPAPSSLRRCSVPRTGRPAIAFSRVSLSVSSRRTEAAAAFSSRYGTRLVPGSARCRRPWTAAMPRRSARGGSLSPRDAAHHIDQAALALAFPGRSAAGPHGSRPPRRASPPESDLSGNRARGANRRRNPPPARGTWAGSPPPRRGSRASIRLHRRDG